MSKHPDFVGLGRSLQIVVDELNGTVSKKEHYLGRAVQFRKDLDGARGRLEYLRKTDRTLQGEVVDFQRRSTALTDDIAVRAHTIKSLEYEVSTLQQERDLVQMEIEELQLEVRQEKDTKERLNEIIAKAQRELKCQRQEVSAFKKDVVHQAKAALRLKARLKVLFFFSGIVRGGSTS